MKSKIHAFPIILTTIVVAFIAIVGFSRMKNQFQNYKSEKITIGKSEFTAYIADTPQLQEQGLSGTQKIPENSGMLVGEEEAGSQNPSASLIIVLTEDTANKLLIKM